jgi:hypothetical protein
MEQLTTYTHGEAKFDLIMEPLVEKDLMTVMTEKGDGVNTTNVKMCTIACNMFDGLAFVHEQG